MSEEFVLPGFVLCSDASGCYAYRSSSGEEIREVNSDGDASGLDRRYSYWRRSHENHHLIIPNISIFTTNESESHWGRQRPMDNQLAHALYQKLYDEDSGRFYFEDFSTGATSYFKPPGVSATLPSASDYYYDDEGTAGLEGEVVAELSGGVKGIGWQDEWDEEVKKQSADTEVNGNNDLSFEEASPDDINAKNYEPELTAFDARITGSFHRDNAENSISNHRDSMYPWVSQQTRLSSVVLPSMPTRQAIPSCSGLSYLDSATLLGGPYCRRLGVGKQVLRSIHRLPDQATQQDLVTFAAERGDRLFVTARDILYKEGAWSIGDEIAYFDDRQLKSTSLEPMMLLRAAVEDGPQAVVGVMESHNENPQVQVFGLMNLAKLTYTKADGRASEGGVAALGLTIRVMKKFLNEEAIQSFGLAVLSQLTSELAMRRELASEAWVAATAAAVSRTRTNTKQITLDRGVERKETITIDSPTRHAVDTCSWACKLFSHMAYDHVNRLAVADDGIGLVLQAMRLCTESPTVQINACRAIYNFVYRCEAAHILASEEDALDVVAPILTNFTSDEDLLILAKRTIRALQPDGWQGFADYRDLPSIQMTPDD